MNPNEDQKTIEKNREDFFMFAVHELRTPLVAIRSSAELMLSAYLDQIPNEDMKELLRNIDTASIRLLKIVNNFLDTSRLVKDSAPVQKEIFSITDIIGSVIANLKILAQKKNITLSYESPDQSLPNVFADKDMVGQILINLIGNAIKFTFTGRIRITSVVEKGFIKVSVTDTGIGIAEHDQSLLFTKFQQVGRESALKDAEQGTGLGLYISRLLIGQIGGTLTLEKSVPGVGSVFAFTIPIAQ